MKFVPVFGQSDHNPSENTVFGRIFYAQHTKTSCNPAQNRETERFFPAWESEDERELHREVMRAELAYGMHSREKELAAILAALQEGPTE